VSPNGSFKAIIFAPEQTNTSTAWPWGAQRAQGERACSGLSAAFVG